MEKDTNTRNPQYPEMEDYGNTDGNWDKEEVIADQLPGSNPDQTSADWDKEDVVADGEQSQAQDTPAWDRSDVVADGYDAQGTGVGDQPMDSGSAVSGQFGDFENTGTGVDLTEEMDSNDADPRSGMVKGGQEGEDGLAGLAQYGGEAGDIPPQGSGNIDGNK